MIVAVKALITFMIVIFFGYSKKIALVSAVGLAQIGEFSFILITLGLSLGLVTGEGKDILLASALISIACNPFLVRAGLRWIEARWPEATAQDDVLAHMEEQECDSLGRNIILIVGCGRVGSYALSMLKDKGLELVIVDINRETVTELRDRGFHAIAGDATDETILIEAQIEKAIAVLITLPDPFAVRRVTELTQKLKPQARILVRSHNDEETTFFESQNIDLAVSGTEEIARRMVTRLLGV
jgi:CPA2 family monovalent cation:H+ antiporter-2